ncbi:MAG: NAD(P)H-hydrate dehydratase [Pseudomonadota bacterium]
MRRAPPLETAPEVHDFDARILRSWPLPQADSDADKEDRGRVLIVAGSRELPGAALLAATAALRAGAGKLTVATAQSVAIGLALALPEARVIGLPEGSEGGLTAAGVDQLAGLAARSQSVLMGPGLMQPECSCAFVRDMLGHLVHVPVILDALAMDVVLSEPYLSGAGFAQPILMTPHAGEMAHLTPQTKDEVQADPLQSACEAAARLNAVVVLKGATTLIASPDGQVLRHRAGNASLATSGSGDVLAGLMAGLLARGIPLSQAAAWAVALHAQAGKRLSQRLGRLGSLAREFADEVPALMHSL